MDAVSDHGVLRRIDALQTRLRDVDDDTPPNTLATIAAGAREIVDFVIPEVPVDRELHGFGLSERCLPSWKRLMDFLVACQDHDALKGRDAREARRRVEDGAGRGTPRAYMNAVALLMQTGCQVCGRPRIRKVHWEMMDGEGVRCCRACLLDRTVSDYRLLHDYAIGHAFPSEYERLLREMPHIEKEMYAPRTGGYSLRFYWTASVLVRLGLVADPRTANDMSPADARERLRTLHRAMTDTACGVFVGSCRDDPSLRRGLDHARAIARDATFPASSGDLAARSPAYGRYVKDGGAVAMDRPFLVKVMREALTSIIRVDLREQAGAVYPEGDVALIWGDLERTGSRLAGAILHKTRGARSEAAGSLYRTAEADPEWFATRMAPHLDPAVERGRQDLREREERQRARSEALVARERIVTAAVEESRRTGAEIRCPLCPPTRKRKRPFAGAPALFSHYDALHGARERDAPAGHNA